MNIRILNLYIIIFILIWVGCNTKAMAISGSAKITIKVVDEKNRPIEGADVGIGFQYDKAWASGSTSRKGMSDSHGLFSASAKTNGYIGFRVTKSGFYKSTGAFSFEKLGPFRWKPWNPELTVVLRRIENPVPMYARNTRESKIKIPVAGENVGFDLIAFDWIVPYGKGSVTDFLFHLDMVDNGGDDFEYNLKITFPNKYDGIKGFEEDPRQGSVFKLDRFAPIEGYEKEIEIYLKGLKRGANKSWEDNQHYIFRVRSEEENGKLKKAMYGKILMDIQLGSSKQKGGMPTIEFLYYLNPDYTRNLEYDPEKNLFGPLPPLEQVGIQ